MSELTTLEIIFHEQLTNEVQHCQNTVLALGNLHCPHCEGPGKAARVFFTEVSAVELFPGWKPIHEHRAVDAHEHHKHGFQGRCCTHPSYLDLVDR
jgi:hypothetical protein